MVRVNVKRLKLLARQEKLNNTKCLPCDKPFDRNNTGCKNCPVFKKLNNIGEQLLKCSGKSAASKRTSKQIIAESKSEHGMILTVDRYLDLQDMGVTNQEIAKQYKISKNDLYEWKKWQGLASKREASMAKESDVVCSS